MLSVRFRLGKSLPLSLLLCTRVSLVACVAPQELYRFTTDLSC